MSPRRVHSAKTYCVKLRFLFSTGVSQQRLYKMKMNPSPSFCEMMVKNTKVQCSSQSSYRDRHFYLHHMTSWRSVVLWEEWKHPHGLKSSPSTSVSLCRERCALSLHILKMLRYKRPSEVLLKFIAPPLISGSDSALTHRTKRTGRTACSL